MTCSAFKAHNHWRREVCGQLDLAPGDQELIPTRFTTSISVRACCLCLVPSPSSLKDHIRILFSCVRNVSRISFLLMTDTTARKIRGRI